VGAEASGRSSRRPTKQDRIMTPEAFVATRKRLRLTQQGLADALGIRKSSILLYERGSRRDDGRPLEIPKTVRLALAALCEGITEFTGAA
jgi:transcriptional regulator with XRE-family HTH domain